MNKRTGLETDAPTPVIQHEALKQPKKRPVVPSLITHSMTYPTDAASPSHKNTPGLIKCIRNTIGRNLLKYLFDLAKKRWGEARSGMRSCILVYPVVVARGELGRTGLLIRVRGRATIAGDAVLLGATVARIALVDAARPAVSTADVAPHVASNVAANVASVVISVVIIVGVGAATSVRATVRGTAISTARVIVIAAGFTLIHVDGRISLFVMGSHGEGRLVGIDVVGVGKLAVIVAGEVAIELPVMVGVEADDDGEDPENTIVVGFGLAPTFPRGQKKKGHVRKRGNNIRDKNAKSDNGLANAAGATASVAAIVGSLGGKGGQPDDGEEDIDAQHGPRIGEVAGTLPSRGHEDINPRRDGEEALKAHKWD